MKKRHIAWLVLGVVLAHLALFWYVAGWDALPKMPFVPPPTFIAREASWTDEATGELVTYREYQVSTRLAELEAKGRPPARK